MDALEAIHTRRSIRKYQDKPVPEELLRQILAAAMSAPSANNAQPWQFVVLSDPEILAGFSTLISVSIFGGLLLAMPYILWQVWGFVRPGLRKRERLAVVPLVLGARRCSWAAWRWPTSSWPRRRWTSCSP